MDDVELALRPASEKIGADGSDTKLSTKERKQQEAQCEKDLAKTVPELDLPQSSDTKKGDTLQSKIVATPSGW